MDAAGQLFYSLSIAMGILIAYGSYVPDDANLVQSVNRIEFFDTAVAFLAGVMVIPSVFVFMGTEGMGSGPSLMFVSLPKVFQAMATPGIFVGAVFFLMAIFAPLTSCISVLEAIVANIMAIFHADRKKVTLIMGAVYLIATAVIALGYSIFYVEVKLPNGSTGQLLDIMDYISNSFMMPFISMISTILIGWIVGPKWIIDEVESTGDKFRRKYVYIVMIKYVAPIMMFILFLQSTGILGMFIK
jgi:NSS family neurotransmitter:Na+ symporter